MIEKTLIEECKNNNRKAQAKLFKVLYGKLLAIAFRYVKSKAEAEEITQESFIKIFKNINSFKFNGSFEGWCKHIVFNHSIDYLKSKKTSFISVFDETMPIEISFDNQIDVDNIQKASPEQINKLILKLPEIQRIVFNMHVMDELKHKEIAQELKITEANSKSIYHRAKEKIKQSLNKLEKCKI